MMTYLLLAALGWLVGVAGARWFTQRTLWLRHPGGALAVLRDEFIVWLPCTPVAVIGMVTWQLIAGQPTGLSSDRVTILLTLLAILAVAVWMAPPVEAARERLEKMRKP